MRRKERPPRTDYESKLLAIFMAAVLFVVLLIVVAFFEIPDRPPHAAADFSPF